MPARAEPRAAGGAAGRGPLAPAELSRVRPEARAAARRCGAGGEACLGSELGLAGLAGRSGRPQFGQLGRGRLWALAPEYSCFAEGTVEWFRKTVEALRKGAVETGGLLVSASCFCLGYCVS